MSRLAQCQCGQLQVSVEGEPSAVLVCHCNQCQRRTGSVFNVSAYFRKEQVTVRGSFKEFTRSSDAGRAIDQHFCPHCGATVFWYLEMNPKIIGIAVGAFADPSFPPPRKSIWESSMHPWVELGGVPEHKPEQ